MQFTPLDVRRGDAVFTLRRVSDNELYRLGRHAVAVEEDHLFWLAFYARRRRPPPLTLPEIVVALSRRFGDSGRHFDDYKSSFCFPFHLTTAKGDARGDYLLLVCDWKGGLGAQLHRRFDKRRSGSGFEPFHDTEFSRDDYRFLVQFLEGFAAGYLEAITTPQPGARIDPIPDFVNRVEAAFLLYGYRNGVPFEQQFDSEDEYRAALAKIPDELSQVAIGDTL